MIKWYPINYLNFETQYYIESLEDEEWLIMYEFDNLPDAIEKQVELENNCRYYQFRLKPNI